MQFVNGNIQIKKKLYYLPKINNIRIPLRLTYIGRGPRKLNYAFH